MVSFRVVPVTAGGNGANVNYIVCEGILVAASEGGVSFEDREQVIGSQFSDRD
jgi:hypothetical protein